MVTRCPTHEMAVTRLTRAPCPTDVERCYRAHKREWTKSIIFERFICHKISKHRSWESAINAKCFHACVPAQNYKDLAIHDQIYCATYEMDSVHFAFPNLFEGTVEHTGDIRNRMDAAQLQRTKRRTYLRSVFNALAKKCNDLILQNQFQLWLGNWMRLCIEEWNNCQTSNSVRNPNRSSLALGECARNAQPHNIWNTARTEEHKVLLRGKRSRFCNQRGQEKPTASFGFVFLVHSHPLLGHHSSSNTHWPRYFTNDRHALTHSHTTYACPISSYLITSRL